MLHPLDCPLSTEKHRSVHSSTGAAVCFEAVCAAWAFANAKAAGAHARVAAKHSCPGVIS